MLEAVLESKSRDYARANGGWLCVKLTDRVGIPDRMFIGQGRVFFVEFKQRAAKPSPKQKLALAKLRARGFTAEVIDNFAAFKRLLERMNA